MLDALALDIQVARRCSRYVKPSSGWTFLHQAAYFGARDAVQALVGLGADPVSRAKNGEIPAEVARLRGHAELASIIESSAMTADGLWSPVPDLLPSSSGWAEAEAEARRALLPMRVGYGGAVIDVPAGSRYYVDSFERVLIGWHGTFDPPCGMDGYSMVRESR